MNPRSWCDVKPFDAGRQIADQEYFDNAVLMIAMIKAGVELALEQVAATVSGHC